MNKIDINKDLFLFHGSRNGIDGDINPISRDRCDFGKGFYMGDNINQVKGLVAEESTPYFYQLELKLSEIPNNKILVLKDMEWIYTVLACRKNVKEFNQLNATKTLLNNLNNYDVIIGPIADDRMNIAMREFSKGHLTDKGLMACLQAINYGTQIVLKSDYACSKVVKPYNGIPIIEKDKYKIQQYNSSMRQKSASVVDEKMRDYRRIGIYLDEILKQEQKKEQSIVKIKDNSDNFSNR